MLSLKQLKIFFKYRGDGDAFIRSGTKKERYALQFKDWKLIEKFIQGLIIIRNNSASEKFSINLLKEINENCDSTKTIEKLKRISKKFG